MPVEPPAPLAAGRGLADDEALVGLALDHAGAAAVMAVTGIGRRSKGGAPPGLGVGPGLLGWWHGERLRSCYAMLGRAPAWPPMVAFEHGPPVALESLLALLGIIRG